MGISAKRFGKLKSLEVKGTKDSSFTKEHARREIKNQKRIEK